MVNRHLLVGLFVSAFIHTFLFFSFAKIEFYPKLKEEKRYVKLSLSFVKLEKEVKKKRVLKTFKEKVEGKIKKIKKKRYTRKKNAKKYNKVVKRKVKKKAQKLEKRVARKVVKDVKETKNPQEDRVKIKKEIKTQHSSEEKGEIKKLTEERNVEVAYVNRKIDEGKKFLEENLDLIRSIVLENLTYPYIARRMGWEGTVIISFFLSGSGCDRVMIERSSGFEVLDNEAKNTVERLCDKFPKPKTKVLVKLPVKFILRD